MTISRCKRIRIFFIICKENGVCRYKVLILETNSGDVYAEYE